jgi:hypothetical protein
MSEYKTPCVPKDIPKSILVLAFRRSKTMPMFSKQYVHVDVEIFLIPTPPPTTAEPQTPGKSYQFQKNEVVGVHIDTNGVKHDYNRISAIYSSTHDTMCIALTDNEKDRLVDFIHATQQCKYNTLDAMFSIAAPLFMSFIQSENEFGPDLSAIRSIQKLHAGQCVTLIIQTCIDDNKIKSKLWGYNSRLTTPEEIYQELRTACITINPDALRSGFVQAAR